MDSGKTFCVGGRRKSNTSDILEYEKRNPKEGKVVKVIKGKVDICGRSKSQVLVVVDQLSPS